MNINVQWKGTGFTYWVLIGNSPISPRTTRDKIGVVTTGSVQQDGPVNIEVAGGGLYTVLIEVTGGESIAANNVASDSVLDVILRNSQPGGSNVE